MARKKLSNVICVFALGMIAPGCADVSEETMEAVDRLEEQGHEVTILETPMEERGPRGTEQCPNGWYDTDTIQIRCGIPEVLITRTFGGNECASCQEPTCGGPWVSIVTPILCAPGYDLRLNQAGTCQRCVESDTRDCQVGGCSGQLCYDPAESSGISTCEWRAEYACYRDANCGPHGPAGACAWEQTPDLQACLNANSGGPQTFP